MSVTFAIFFCLFSLSNALYKQWIPDTNFENVSNWDKGRVPCANDRVYFQHDQKASVYVQSTHSIVEMYLPMDGELILAFGAGFAGSEGGSDPGCEGGGDRITFQDPDRYQWYDPTLWRAASTPDDLENGRFQFSVHEESVPCEHDDVIFLPDSSFRVSTDSDVSRISLRSVSIMEKKFSREEEFARYLQSGSGKLQFHGSGTVEVTNRRCSESSGCDCGNTANHERICAALHQHSQCPDLECWSPLTPIGHCCGICGAVVSLEYSPDFNVESYRNRLLHLFLSLPSYRGVRMAMSKVSRPQSFSWLVPREADSEIQVVLQEEGSGSKAEALAWEIMKDIHSQGSSLGIVKGEVQTSTGSHASGQGGSVDGGMIAGAVIGVLLALVGLGSLVVLFTRGMIRVPNLSSLQFVKKDSDLDNLGDSIDKGFDNPMFDTSPHLPADLHGLYSGSEALKGISITNSGVHFVNPAYDETDFTA
ncbi:protein amnionless-like isoform X1 [Acipenser ruthenus]|uniref:protein amnionless-like isoform X1 n=1 Tax=Acipenser ruthenus TaxID=7906 RepID=UPI0027410EC8|nr:protein amnionless-like isoform X1 [Acipenser ruthenus]